MGAPDQTLDKDAHQSVIDDGRTLRPVGEDEYLTQCGDDNGIQRSLPSYAREAFLFRGEELTPEVLQVHGETFIATEWESSFSTLSETATEDEKFTPVLDSNYRIVGHLGWIGGDKICVPRNTIAEYSPNAAAFQKARLGERYRQIVLSHIGPPNPFNAQTVSAAPTKRPAPCWPANKPPAFSFPKSQDEALWNSLLDAPGVDPSEELRHRDNINFFLAGGGTAIVGLRFGWYLLPTEQWFAKGPDSGPPYDTYLTSPYRCMVLVAPNGHIQEVLRVEEFHRETRNQKYLRIALEVLDVALTIWMVIDIATVPVALFRLGQKVAEKAVVAAVRVIVDTEAKTALEAAAREVTEGALRRGARGAMTGPERAEAKTAWAEFKRKFWDAGKVPPSQTFSEQQVKDLSEKISKRMNELGIPKKNQGAGVWRLPPRDEMPLKNGFKMEARNGENGLAFNPTGGTRGANVRSTPYEPRYGGEGGGISVHGNVFDRWEGFNLWNDASTTIDDKIDAIIAHEWSEFNGLTHWETVELMPETKLAITPRARQLSRYMMLMGGEPEMAFTEFTKAEWEAIVEAGKANAPFEEKLKIARALGPKGKK